MEDFFIIKLVVLLVCLMLALYYDVREQKIKNYITIPSALLGLLINSLDSGTQGLLFSVKGWLIPIAVLMPLYYINVMGAGDIKLFGSIGAVMGLSFVSYSFAYSIFVGGVIALGLLIKTNQFMAKMNCLYLYFGTMVLTGRLSSYSAKGDNSSKFIFTVAIVPGTVIQLICT